VNLVDRHQRRLPPQSWTGASILTDAETGIESGQFLKSSTGESLNSWGNKTCIWSLGTYAGAYRGNPDWAT
jgi:hypothetical protein